MTVQMLHNFYKTTTEDKVKLLQLANDLLESKTIELSDYASLQASINKLSESKK